MDKQKRAILQPNELSNDAVISMRTRIISALVGLAIVLPFVIFGDWPFFALVSVVLVFAIIEIIRCAKTKYSKTLYIVAFVLAFLILLWNILQDFRNGKINDSWRLFDAYNRITVSTTIMFIGICICAVTILIDKNFTIIDACFIFTTVIIIALGLESALFIRYFPVCVHHSALDKAGQTVPYINLYDNCTSFFFLLYMGLGACLNDAFAYFVGVFFGRNKMNERISPKKTWEGFFGGVILTSITLSGYAFIFAVCKNPLLPGLLDIEHWYHIVILSTLIPLVSTLGDMVFSSIKRHYQIKDFSNLIPGHGGILDRLDSLLFAAITMAIYTSIFFDATGGISLP